MKKLIYHFIKNFSKKNYIIIMKKLSYLLIIFVWSFIIISHSKAGTKKSELACNSDKLVSPILYVKKLINKEIEKTKKYQKKIWKKEKTKLSGFFSRFPDS